MNGILAFVLLLNTSLLFPQSDSSGINRRREYLIGGGAAAFYGLSVVGMNELWYKNYEHSSFHWVDDSREWLQMDKTGHFLSSYTASRILFGGFHSGGMSEMHSLILSSGLALAGISTIEVFDGFSSGWGASASDLAFNSAGVLLFAAQELAWNEQWVIPKISWHPTDFAHYRPDVLGSSLPERMMKDYNGHTIWLSLNLRSLTGADFLPPWLCLSPGYGAEGMISGYDDPSITPYFKRYRQYYLSLDADLSKIKTRSKALNAVLKAINLVKVPFPGVEFSPGNARWLWLAF
jgi:hypothetical protein